MYEQEDGFGYVSCEVDDDCNGARFCELWLIGEPGYCQGESGCSEEDMEAFETIYSYNYYIEG